MLYFGRGRFCSSEYAKFEKNLQKAFALSFELRETAPFSFNDNLDCLPPLEGIVRDFKVRQCSLDYSYFLQFFLQTKVFSCYWLRLHLRC